MKLFSDTEELDLSARKVKTKDLGEVDSGIIDKDIEALENHVDAYVSVSNVYDEVSSEAFSFVDKKNYTLFNEYMNVIGKNLGIKNVPVVSTEAMAILPTVALNHHIALEGFIGDMWEKVKTLFKKIYEGIKEFFAKHFTRMGILKKKLNNLKEVLGETDKDIKQLNLDKIPSSISSKFPYSGTVDEGLVSKALATSDIVISVLEVTNKEAISLANKDILSKDFVAKIKSLKEQIGANKEKMASNDAVPRGGIIRKSDEKKAAIAENKTLSQINDENKGNLDKEENALSDTVGSKENLDAVFNDDGYLAAQKEMTAYMKKVEEAFSKLVDKPIPGGKTITEVKVTQDNGIDITFDTNKDAPDTVSLGARNGLTKLVSTALSNLETMEKITENYTKVNDIIIKNLDTVDKLINEVDKMSSQAEYSVYKQLLQKKVKERLKLMQGFFTNYNKINKNLIGIVADSCDGVVAYTVASLKHFG